MTPSPLALARAAAQAAREVGEVADLSAGSVGEYATYGAGERQPGVRAVTGDTPRIGLRIVARYPAALPEVADEVRRRVQAAVGQLLQEGPRALVDVHVVDVVPAVPTPAVLPSGTSVTTTPVEVS